MATARMRHHNSPEELAKRSGEAEPVARKGKEFRHYNHPEEVAKREANGGGGVAVTKRVINTTGEPPVWPPPGTEDNTAAVSATWPDEAKPPEEAPPADEAPTSLGDFGLRLRRVENLLWTFVDGVQEAREFRRLLSNQQAVTDAQLDIRNRLSSLEQTIEAALAEEDDTEEPPPALPPLEDDVPPVDGVEAPDAPPTVPDNPSAGGST